MGPPEHRLGVGLDRVERIAIVGMVGTFARVAHEYERAGAHGAGIAAVARDGLVARQRRPIELDLLREVFRPIAAKPTGRMIAAPWALVARPFEQRLHAAPALTLCSVSFMIQRVGPPNIPVSDMT